MGPTKSLTFSRGPKDCHDIVSIITITITTVDRRNPANQLRLVVYPIISKVLYMLDGAGFQPSTVLLVHIFRLLYSTFLLPYIAIYLLLLLVILLPKMVYLGTCRKKKLI